MLLFVGLVASGAFLLFGIASWLGSIPTKAAVFIGAVPPILFVIAGVWLLRSPDGSVAFNTDGLYWRWPVGLGFLVAAGACLDPACGGPRTTTTRRAAARTSCTSGNTACASSTSRCWVRLLTGLTLLVAVWSVPHVYHLIDAQARWWPQGRPLEFGPRRDRRGLPVHRGPRQEIHLVGVFHAAHPR